MNVLIWILEKIFWEKIIKILWRYTIGYIIDMFTYKKRFQELSSLHEALNKRCFRFYTELAYLDIMEGNPHLIMRTYLNGSSSLGSFKEEIINVSFNIQFNNNGSLERDRSVIQGFKNDYIYSSLIINEEGDIGIVADIELRKNVVDLLRLLNNSGPLYGLRFINIKEESYFKIKDKFFVSTEKNIGVTFSSNWKL